MEHPGCRPQNPLGAESHVNIDDDQSVDWALNMLSICFVFIIVVCLDTEANHRRLLMQSMDSSSSAEDGS